MFNFAEVSLYDYFQHSYEMNVSANLELKFHSLCFLQKLDNVLGEFDLFRNKR